jgi:predicted nuclease of predicted toxin-antitoxin system
VTLKLLIDQGLPRLAAQELRRLGFDSVHTGEIGMAAAADHAILAYAQGEGRTVVTLDSDFHALLALSNARGPSVIRLRIEGLRGGELATLVKRVIESCEPDLSHGAMVTVDERSVRVRMLPLVAGML